MGKIIDVYILGVMNCMAAVMENMKNRKGGTIINLFSIAGIQSFHNHTAYAATKYGVRGLTQTARLELFPFNCKSNL